MIFCVPVVVDQVTRPFKVITQSHLNINTYVLCKTFGYACAWYRLECYPSGSLEISAHKHR